MEIWNLKNTMTDFKRKAKTTPKRYQKIVISNSNEHLYHFTI